MATHHFEPDHYHIALGTYEPVLRIADGDTVVTTTIDASGHDRERRSVGGRPNPQTGPFFVEGAKPGDTLAVRLDRIRPNRRYGFTGTRLAANVVDPGYVAEFPKDAPRGEWDVDADSNTATLVQPETKLGRFTIPLRPMLGCFGVAPAGGQAISTATSGEHGGNMDYKGFEAGVTVFFPVFVPGALFFLGDGHAVQGDGEIVGTGVEISMDVQFTVTLQKGRRIGWPRAENATHILTAGNARPLDQALQHATTEMARWLQNDYGLDPLGAHTLLGQCVEYEVGNVFDPAYTMICKMSKQVLAPYGGGAA
jgi:acetamidase/formamidase